MSWFKNAWKSIKKATKSPIFHVVEGGLALAFPAVAIPAAAALTMGNKALDMANSSNAAVRARYRTVIENTEKAAAAGHPGAKRAVAAMMLAKDAKAGKPAALAEVAKIRAHAAHFRLAGQVVAKRFVMHPRTGIVALRGRPAPQKIAGADDEGDAPPDDEGDAPPDDESSDDSGGGDDSGGESGGGDGGGGGAPSPAEAVAMANSEHPATRARGRAHIAHVVHHAKAGNPRAKQHAHALQRAHHEHHGKRRGR